MSDSGRGARSDDDVRAEAIAWLSALRSSDSADHQAFEDWYAANPRHADIYDEVLANWETMHLAAHTPAAEAPSRQASPARGRTTMKWAIAAIAVLVLALLSSIGFTTSTLVAPDRARPTEIASAVGEIRTVRLEDGSRVTLDTGTLIAVAYSAGERRLTLERGRARFDVTHDPARPFVVAAGGSIVIAHGTLFDVDLLAPRVTVSLLRGSIEVKNNVNGLGGDAGRGRLLVPGQRIALEPRKPPGNPVALRDGETRWPSGMLSFEDAPLSAVVAAANRYTTEQVRVAGAETGAFRFTGTFAARDAEGLARMLAATFDLDLSRGGRGSLILAARDGHKKVPG